MDRRLELQTKLETFLGSRNVYFQPPPAFQMSYPCIVYQLQNIKVDHADNILYSIKDRYSVTIIDRDPDTSLPKKLLEFRHCSFSSRYAKDGLTHIVFSLYF